MMDDGWPLGLERLNVRVALVRNPNLSASSLDSVSTLFTVAAPSIGSSSSSSIDGSSFEFGVERRGVTLRSLLREPAAGILQLSRRRRASSLSSSSRPSLEEEHPRSPAAKNNTNVTTNNNINKSRSTNWFHSLCSKPTSNEQNDHSAPQLISLADYLEEERRARRRSQTETSAAPYLLYGRLNLNLN